MSCVVRGCKSVWYPTSGVKFHSFPKDPIKKNAWLSVVPLKGKISESSRICSLHFKNADYNSCRPGCLLNDAIPFCSYQLCKCCNVVNCVNVPSTYWTQSHTAVNDNVPPNAIPKTRYWSHHVLHGFPNPLKEPDRFSLWLKTVHGDNFNVPVEHIYKYRRVCHSHFEHKYCCRYNRICNIAHPTLNMPGTSDGTDKPVIQTADGVAGPNKPSESNQETNIDEITKEVSPIGTDLATHDKSTIDNDNPILDDHLDITDSEVCNEVSNEDVPVDAPKEFSWQQLETTVDLAEDDGEGETEDLQDDLSLYCSDDEENRTLYGYTGDPGEHAGFRCNVCNKQIVGFRYVCVQCSDFDLCGGCEAQGAHHQHYVLRVPGPRPYGEVQSVLARIRKHLMVSMDPIQVADDAVSIKSELKYEDEEVIHQEVDPQIEPGDSEDIAKENQETSQDEGESSQDEMDPLHTHNTTDAETMDDSEAEWTPSKEDLDNIETTDHEGVPSNTKRYTRTRLANVKPITEDTSTNSNIEQTSQEQQILKKNTEYIKVKPLRSISKPKPIIIKKNNTITPLSISKADPRIVLSRVNLEELIPLKMNENVCMKKRRIITGQSEFEKFSNIYPPAKKVFVPVVSKNLLNIAKGHRLPVSVTRVFTPNSTAEDNTNR